MVERRLLELTENRRSWLPGWDGHQRGATVHPLARAPDPQRPGLIRNELTPAGRCKGGFPPR